VFGFGAESIHPMTAPIIAPGPGFEVNIQVEPAHAPRYPSIPPVAAPMRIKMILFLLIITFRTSS
jgi:hypothetical protein